MSQDTANSSTPRFALLTATNYTQWAGNAKAWFMRQGLWGVVSGKVPKPGILDSKAPTTAELENISS